MPSVWPQNGAHIGNRLLPQFPWNFKSDRLCDDHELGLVLSMCFISKHRDMSSCLKSFKELRIWLFSSSYQYILLYIKHSASFSLQGLFGHHWWIYKTFQLNYKKKRKSKPSYSCRGIAMGAGHCLMVILLFLIEHSWKEFINHFEFLLSRT